MQKQLSLPAVTVGRPSGSIFIFPKYALKPNIYNKDYVLQLKAKNSLCTHVLTRLSVMLYDHVIIRVPFRSLCVLKHDIQSCSILNFRHYNMPAVQTSKVKQAIFNQSSTFTHCLISKCYKFNFQYQSVLNFFQNLRNTIIHLDKPTFVARILVIGSVRTCMRVGRVDQKTLA